MVGWAKAHHLYSLELEEPGLAVWAFKPTGEGHFPSGCRGRYRPLLQWCHIPLISARVFFGCCGWFRVLCYCLLWVEGVGRHLRRVLEKWVQSQAGRVPNIRSASPETMPGKSVLFRFWIFGSLLDDEIYCNTFEGGRASRLDDVTFQSSSWHIYRRAVNAVASWDRQQHCGECGFSSWSTIKRLTERPTATN